MRNSPVLHKLLGMVPEQVRRDPWVGSDPINFVIATASNEDRAIAQYIASRLAPRDVEIIRTVMNDDPIRWMELGHLIKFALEKRTADT